MKELSERELLHIQLCYLGFVVSYEVFCLSLFNVLFDLSVLLIYSFLKNSSSELSFFLVLGLI